MNKKSLFVITMSLLIALTSICISSNAQDKVYASFISGGFYGSSEVKSIIANPSTGVTTGGFGNDMTVQKTAGIGYGIYSGVGWILSLQYTTDNHVDIYARKADGSGSNVKIKNNAEIGNTEDLMDYVRLGIDQNGVGWIISKESWSTDIHVASFTWNGNTANAPVFTKRGTLTTTDNSNSVFINGDLAVAGGTIFVLANNGYDITKIYTVSSTTLLAANSSSITNLGYKWTLKKADGSDFNSSVNGFAFSSTGSAYLSTSVGLYFIDQFSTNFSGTGTVKCTLKKSESDLSDLATGYWPATTALPVKIRDIKVTLSYSKIK